MDRTSNKTHQSKSASYLLNSKQDLKPYARFPKILGEMKYGKKFLENSAKISFLELAVEIRVKIYRHHFRFEEPIEFLASECTTNNVWWTRRRMNRQFAPLVRRRDLNLGFLRTCRRIHAEASEVFYGENEFRFSGMNGHIFAYLWMRKIYKQHYQWLTHLTIPMPFEFTGRNTGIVTLRQWNNFFEQLPFRSWCPSLPFRTCISMEPASYLSSIEQLVQYLARADRFKKLTLLVCNNHQDPQDFEFSDADKDMFGWLKSMSQTKPRIEIEIVVLPQHEQFPFYYVDSYHSEWFMRRRQSSIRQMKSLFKVILKGARAGPQGHWKIVKDLTEKDLLPPGESDEQESEYDSEVNSEDSANEEVAGSNHQQVIEASDEDNGEDDEDHDVRGHQVSDEEDHHAIDNEDHEGSDVEDLEATDEYH